MSNFTIKPTPIAEGPMIIRPTEYGLSRDYLNELEPREILSLLEVETPFVELNRERYARGVVRGLHFQSKGSYAKMIAVTSGRILDVAVDLRPESKTFGASHAVELSAENETMFYIPPYFAHGFLTLEANTEVVFNCTAPHDPKEESGIIFDDEILAINYQFERYDIDEKRLSLTPRDRKLPCFRSYNPNSLWVNRPKKSKYALNKPFVYQKERP